MVFYTYVRICLTDINSVAELLYNFKHYMHFPILIIEKREISSAINHVGNITDTRQFNYSV